jgi:hypothetical protein
MPPQGRVPAVPDNDSHRSAIGSCAQPVDGRLTYCLEQGWDRYFLAC